jgi:Tfp pilus assembly protein PilX
MSDADNAAESALAAAQSALAAAQSSLNAAQSSTGLIATQLTANLKAWAASPSWTPTAATRDANGALLTASVVWPDGGTGTFTADALSTAWPGAIDAWHVTYSLSGVNKTVTQALVTRDPISGAAVGPALIVT